MSRLVSRKGSKNKTLETKEIESIRWKAVGLTYIWFLVSILLWRHIDFNMSENMKLVFLLVIIVTGYILSNFVLFLCRKDKSSFQWCGWKREVEIIILGFSPILWIVDVLFFSSFEVEGKISLFEFVSSPVFILFCFIAWLTYAPPSKGVIKKEKIQQAPEQISSVKGGGSPAVGSINEPTMLKDDFIRKVQTDLFPKLDEKKFKKHKRNTVILAMILLLIIMYWGYDQHQKNLLSIEKLCAIGVIGLALIYMFYSRFKIKYVLKTKDQLFKWLNIPQIDFLGTNVSANIVEKKLRELCFLFGQLNIRGGIFSSIKKKAELKDLLKVELVRDAFFDTETGLAFHRANARIYEGMLTIPNGKSSTTLFDGILIEIKLDRIFSTPIVFRKRSFFTWGNRLQKVSLPRKDSYFDVYAWSEQDARNLYYQGVTSKLRRIKEIFKVKKIAASFYQDKLYIALYTEKDVFEPIRSRFHDIKQYETFYDEVVQLEEYCLQFKDI